MLFPKGTPASVIAQGEKNMREGKLGANLDFSKPVTKPGLGVKPNVKGTFSGPDKYAVLDPVRPVGTGKPLPAPKPSSISKNPMIAAAIKRDQASAKKPVAVAPPVKKATPPMPAKPAPKAVSKIPGGKKAGGVIKSSASKRADGIAQRGKTKGRMV